ncbi:MAG: hypothetical protein U0T73_05985, partial [Chitinophagales bacterium]
RRNKQGKVIIQTSNPQHHIIQQVVSGNYQPFYISEMNERHRFFYPPFTRMVQLTLKHRDLLQVEKAALYLANNLRRVKCGEVLGPSKPLIERLNNVYLREILIKTNATTTDLNAFKHQIRFELERLKMEKELKSVTVAVNVDP